jgi:hypothetical protein
VDQYGGLSFDELVGSVTTAEVCTRLLDFLGQTPVDSSDFLAYSCVVESPLRELAVPDRLFDAAVERGASLLSIHAEALVEALVRRPELAPIAERLIPCVVVPGCAHHFCRFVVDFADRIDVGRMLDAGFVPACLRCLNRSRPPVVLGAVVRVILAALATILTQCAGDLLALAEPQEPTDSALVIACQLVRAGLATQVIASAAIQVALAALSDGPRGRAARLFGLLAGATPDDALMKVWPLLWEGVEEEPRDCLFALVNLASAFPGAVEVSGSDMERIRKLLSDPNYGGWAASLVVFAS